MVQFSSNFLQSRDYDHVTPEPDIPLTFKVKGAARDQMSRSWRHVTPVCEDLPNHHAVIQPHIAHVMSSEHIPNSN